MFSFKRAIVTGLSLVLIYLLGISLTASVVPLPLKPNLPYELGGLGHTFTKIKAFEASPEYDVLFVGASVAYRSFDPRIYKEINLEIFNLGTTAQTPINSLYLLEKYAESILENKLVVLAVHPSPFMIDGLESTIDLLANDNIDKTLINQTLEHGNIKAVNALIAGVFDEFIWKRKASFHEPIRRKKDRYVGRGYVERDLMYFEAKPSSAITPITFNENQEKAFTKVIELLENKGNEVVLVFPPIPNATYQTFSNWSTFHDKMNDFGAYIDMNNPEIYMDSIHFVDYAHLNQLGVEIFNRKLIDTLHAMNYLETPSP